MPVFAQCGVLNFIHVLSCFLQHTGITINDIAKGIDNNLQIDAAILHFSKAFDRVSHSRLLYKLD